MRWLVFVLTMLVCPLGFAQSTPGTAPIKISNPAATTSMYGETMTFSVTNVSGKDIRGFTVCVPALKRCTTAMRGMWPPPFPDSFKAGEVTAERMRDIPLAGGKTAAQYSLSIDYVLFSDGSGWGPDVFRHEMMLHGLWTGHEDTLHGLQAMLKRSGPEAVMDYIENSSGH